METLKLIPAGRFVIDVERELVYDSERKNFRAEIIQTQSGLIRDDVGEVVGVEVLHLCRTPDGEEFVIEQQS